MNFIEPIKSEEVLPDLFSSRLIVLLEIGPQRNQYHQIMLTKEKWQKVSDLMKSLMEPCTNPEHLHTEAGEHATIYLYNDFKINVPDKIENHYPEEFIKKS